MRKLKTLSLFSGCGGLDLGFHQEGFLNVGAYDINPAVIDTFRANIADNAHVEDLSLQTIKPRSAIDVLLAGSPCQGFSLAGKRNVEDPRNNLLIRAGDHAIALRPKIFLAENVPGALSGEMRRYWDQLDQMLIGAGYKTRTLSIDASHLGVAQTRRRIFLLACRDNLDFEYVLPAPKSVASLAQALDDIPNDREHAQSVVLEEETADIKIARHIGPGQKLSNVRRGPNSVHTWHIPDVFGRTTVAEQRLLMELIVLRRRIRVRTSGDADPVAFDLLRAHVGSGTERLVGSLVRKNYLRYSNDAVDLANTFNGKYRRLMWEKPSYTVDTYFGNPRYFLHPVEHRGFSVREAARIQGFPDGYTFTGTMKENFQMIGNAVSPVVSRHLAQLVKSLLL